MRCDDDIVALLRAAASVVHETDVSLYLDQKACARVADEIELMRADMQRIWDICHIPTKKTRFEKAYTHFQHDFDAIRAIAKPYLAQDRTTGGGSVGAGGVITFTDDGWQVGPSDWSAPPRPA